jgi:hypothetical protein
MLRFVLVVLTIIRKLATGLANLSTLNYTDIQTNVFLRAFDLRQIKFDLKPNHKNEYRSKKTIKARVYLVTQAWTITNITFSHLEGHMLHYSVKLV